MASDMSIRLCHEQHFSQLKEAQIAELQRQLSLQNQTPPSDIDPLDGVASILKSQIADLEQKLQSSVYALCFPFLVCFAHLLTLEVRTKCN
jgi:hypothetical protein